MFQKIQENSLPEEQQPQQQPQQQQQQPAQQPQQQTEPDKPKDMLPKINMDKTTVPIPVVVPPPAARVSVPTFTKSAPNDLYRRLLPAVLFVLTFVTVMTMLLIYMDTVGELLPLLLLLL